MFLILYKYFLMMLPLFHVELNKMFKKKFMKIIYSGNIKKTFDLIKN